MKDKETKDSFELFMNQFGIDEIKIIEFGLKESIFMKPENVAIQWSELKNKIENNNEVFVRNYGRIKGKQDKLLDFYKTILKLENVEWDPTNNTEPTKLISSTLQLKKNRDIFNYKVSHVWGKTINPYSFTAAWNIVYVPTVIDPFTGHESKGDLCEKYKVAFRKHTYNLYKKEIDDFNSIMTNLSSSVNSYINQIDSIKDVCIQHLNEFKEHLLDSFKPIEL